jgi:TolB protein
MNPRFALLFFLCLDLPARAEPVAIIGKASLATGALHPALSPDGSRIAVSSQGMIGVLPVAGGTLRILTHDSGWDVYPTWSPDGKQIAYLNAPSFSVGHLRLIDAKSGLATPLPRRVYSRGPVQFHPDGKRIIGKLTFRGVSPLICAFNLSSGDLTPVKGYTDNWGRTRAAHAMSPDGKWICFSEQADIRGQQGGNNGPQTDVFRLPIAGGKAEKIFQWPARIYHLTATVNPPGLLATTDRGVAHNDVWFLPQNDPVAGAEKLTFGIADEDCPTVDAAGSQILFTDNRHGATTLARLDRETGARREIPIRELDYGRPTRRVVLEFPPSSDGGPQAWRVSIQQENGKFFSPPGSMYHLSAGLGYSITRGNLSLKLPLGNYAIRVFRGPEYHATETQVDLGAGAGAKMVRINPRRWINMRAQGWYSGENHIHANYGYGSWYNTPQSMLDFSEAEDLHVSNLVVANSDGDAVFDREFFIGKPDPLSRPDTLLWWNEEFRSTIWGHLTLFHLKQLVEPIFTGFQNTTNPRDIPTNGEIARRARMQTGAVSYTHPTNNKEEPYDQPYSAKGLPVDAALGLIDCVDVMGVVYDNALPFWYRFLNAGMRLPAAAGTDCFLNRVYMAPPGWGRVYVHLPDGFSYQKWVTAVKAGRSFVSNGPMLEFTAVGRQSGDTIRMARPAKIPVRAEVRSKYPLERVEIVFNGEVIASGRLDEQSRNGMIDADVQIPHSGWLAFRAYGKAVRHWQGRSHSAHTNPIFVQVKDHPQDTKESAEYFLKWIDRLEADLKQRNRIPTAEAKDVQRHLEMARAVYRSKRDGSGSSVVR